VADWGIAAMAHKLGHKETERTFARRARYWKHYFDGDINFIRPKFDDGSWLTPYNPFQSVHGGTGYFAEGTGWQYTFFVPQDPYGLIEAMGGDEPFRAKIDSLFRVSGDMGPHASADISGLIGQYAHGNEPSHHVIYLYNYAGQQWKTAELVRYVQHHFYTDRPDGIIGNEDCGQMSAWHILSALGFYQVNPSCGVYSFGSPLFEKAVLNMPNGRKFMVTTENNSAKNSYIQSVELNGKPYLNSYIAYEDIVRGGTLKFVMGPQPNYDFGCAPEHRPYNETRQ
ncbi:glycoside hydrolase family 92 protein, partial [Alistipes finegoldii]